MIRQKLPLTWREYGAEGRNQALLDELLQSIAKLSQRGSRV